MAKEKTNAAANLEDALKQIDLLQAANDALQEKVATLEAAKATADKDEVLIAEKTALGITREQAISSIKRQREFDARKAEAAKAAQPTKAR